MMGSIYGLLFGWMDIEDANAYTISIKMLKEEKYCLVIGVILGALGGFVNEMIGRNVNSETLKNNL
mgnify:CR=1 FL=1